MILHIDYYMYATDQTPFSPQEIAPHMSNCTFPMKQILLRPQIDMLGYIYVTLML